MCVNNSGAIYELIIDIRVKTTYIRKTIITEMEFDKSILM